MAYYSDYKANTKWRLEWKYFDSDEYNSNSFTLEILEKATWETVTEWDEDEEEYVERYVHNTIAEEDIIELQGTDCPFELQTDKADDRFNAMNGSTGYIHIVVRNAEEIAGLLSKTFCDHVVILRNADIGNDIAWVGYINAETFDYEWGSYPYIMDIPVKSVLAMSNFVKYEIKGRTRYICDMIGYIADMLSISKIYFPFGYYTKTTDTQIQELLCAYNDTIYKYRQSKGSGTLRHATSCGDVLRDIAEFFGYQIVEIKGELWFLAVDATIDYVKARIIEPASGGTTYKSDYYCFNIQKSDIQQSPILQLGNYNLYGNDHTQRDYAAMAYISFTEKAEAMPDLISKGNANLVVQYNSSIPGGFYSTEAYLTSELRCNKKNIRNGFKLSIGSVYQAVGGGEWKKISVDSVSVRIQVGGYYVVAAGGSPPTTFGDTIALSSNEAIIYPKSGVPEMTEGVVTLSIGLPCSVCENLGISAIKIEGITLRTNYEDTDVMVEEELTNTTETVERESNLSEGPDDAFNTVLKYTSYYSSEVAWDTSPTRMSNTIARMKAWYKNRRHSITLNVRIKDDDMMYLPAVGTRVWINKIDPEDDNMYYVTGASYDFFWNRCILTIEKSIDED